MPNRRYFKYELALALENIRETEKELALIMLDIDHFKQINDTFGHDVGDAVIKEFGSRIDRVIGEKGTTARLGGDEFVILLYHVESKEDVISIVDGIHEEVSRPWSVADHLLKVTTSMGIALTSTKPTTPQLLLKTADNALYEAKDNGKNTYKLLDE